MQFRLALVLFVSCLLIGVASWNRFFAPQEYKNMAAIEQFEVEEEYYDDILDGFLEPKAETASLPSEPLTNTDLLGRQLVSDYLNLAASGQASESNVLNLVKKYVESVPTLAATPKLDYLDLKIVPDTKINVETYAETMLEIHDAYSRRIAASYLGDRSVESLNPAMHSFLSAFGKAYEEAVERLRNVSVPTSLAQPHLELVNRYLSSAQAMINVSATEEDPATAFASVIVFKENVAQEDLVRTKIGQIIDSYGI